MIKNGKEVISQQERICKSVFSQALGLMFRKKQNLIMIFPKERKVSLHMFFVFYPIEVILLNENKEVVETATLKPFSFWSSKKRCKYLIELGFMRKVNLGEKLDS